LSSIDRPPVCSATAIATQEEDDNDDDDGDDDRMGLVLHTGQSQ
jgi:hypothetical protein